MMKKVLLMIMALIVCLALVACGQVQEKQNEEEKVQENAQENMQEANTEIKKKVGEEGEDREITGEPDEMESAQKAIDDMEIYSDDTKYVVTLENNTTGIYYHDGEKITGYEVRVKYNTHEEAELAKAEYAKDNNEDDSIESVEVKGNELIATFKPSEYEDTTLSEIKTAFELIKAMQGSNNE